MTTVTQLRRREESVNLLDPHAVLACKILQLADELAVGEVLHLASPQRGHARELQVLYADGVEAAAQVVRQLPLPVVAAVDDEFLYTVLRQPRDVSVFAAFLLLREAAVCCALHAECLLQIARRLDALASGECHVGLQPKVDAHGCTIMCLSDRLALGLDEEVHEIFPDGSALHSHVLDCAYFIVWSAQRELEAFLDFVDSEHVPVQRVAALLEHEALEVVGPLELGRPCLYVLEETLVGLVLTLQYLLHGLRVMTVALAVPLHPLLLHSRHVDVLLIHSIVPLLKGKRMVPHPRCLAEHRVKMLRLLGRIELILVGYHALLSNMGQYFALLWHIVLSHRGLSAARRGYCPNRVPSRVDTTNATFSGGIFVPHNVLSTTKIHIILDMAKQSGYILSKFKISCYDRPLQLPLPLRLQPWLSYNMVSEVPPQVAPMGHRRAAEDTACRESHEDGMQDREDGSHARPCAYLHQDTAHAFRRHAGAGTERIYLVRPSPRVSVATEDKMPVVTILLRREYRAHQRRDSAPVYRRPERNGTTEGGVAFIPRLKTRAFPLRICKTVAEQQNQIDRMAGKDMPLGGNSRV